MSAGPRSWPTIRPALERALRDGLTGVAVLSPAGEAIEVAGELENYGVRALAALVSKSGPPDLLNKLFGGEIVTAAFDKRIVHLAIAERCVFVIAVSEAPSSITSAGESNNPSLWAAVVRLCSWVSAAIRYARNRSPDDWIPPSDGGTGSGSPPAEAMMFLSNRRRGGGDPN